MATTIDDQRGGINRRDFIYIGTAAFAAIGAAAAIWPLLDQLNPDASTLSLASIEVDLAPVQPGQAITMLWRGKPIFIRNRTPEEVEKAKEKAKAKIGTAKERLKAAQAKFDGLNGE